MKKVENKKKIEEEFDIKEIYTPLSVAKKEIWKRWNDKELRKKVEDFLGGDIPDVFKDGPKATLFRFMATPNYECKHFLDLAEMIELEPVYIEFADDKFCTRNKDKLYLGKLGFFGGYDKKGDKIMRYEKIIDIEKNDNIAFKEIKTIWGEKLIDFHKKIFHLHNNKNIKKLDIAVLKENGNGPLSTYKKLFPLFTCYGVFFENYFLEGNGYEKKFFSDVVRPAFEITEKKFGVRPLVVPILGMLGESEQKDLFWQFYPNYLSEKIK